MLFHMSPSDPLCTRYMEFVCKNRAQCLFQSLVCDGIKHCEDGSDEDAEYAGCGKRHRSLVFDNVIGFCDVEPLHHMSTTLSGLTLLCFVLC